MVVTGALVAGIRAGYAYNTWPLMNGHVVPPEIWLIDPWWKNFAFNMAMVQFNHRTLAIVVVACAAAAWVLQRREAVPAIRHWGNALAVAVALQFALGITTLLMRAALPLAAIHQAFAVVVFTCVLGFAHAVLRRGLQP
jgi:cytochrome c oxidase assembly protein subunit 15